jgi:hypothetical protein
MLPRMSAIALCLRKRRDGSLCLANLDGLVNADDRAFPAEHDFQFSQIGRDIDYFEVDAAAGKLTLRLANAVGEFEITERSDSGFHVKLVKQTLIDTPPIDEDKAAELRAARGETEAPSAQAVSTTEAMAGQAVVDLEGVQG